MPQSPFINDQYRPSPTFVGPMPLPPVGAGGVANRPAKRANPTRTSIPWHMFAQQQQQPMFDPKFMLELLKATRAPKVTPWADGTVGPMSAERTAMYDRLASNWARNGVAPMGGTPDAPQSWFHDPFAGKIAGFRNDGPSRLTFPDGWQTPDAGLQQQLQQGNARYQRRPSPDMPEGRGIMFRPIGGGASGQGWMPPQWTPLASASAPEPSLNWASLLQGFKSYV